MSNKRKSERNLTVKSSELLAKKLEERHKKKTLKVNKKISPQEGSSQNNIETEKYFDSNIDLEVDLSANSEESQEDIENPDNHETIEEEILEALNNLFSAIESVGYS